MPRTRPDEDIDIWVERCTRYYAIADLALDPLRETLSRTIFGMLYEEQSMLWIEEQKANPRIVSKPGNRLAREVFFQNIDAICATFDTVDKTDWKALLRINFAAQAGSFAIAVGGNPYPPNSSLRNKIMVRTTAKMQVINANAIIARREREIAQWSRIQGMLQRPGSPPQGISLKQPMSGPEVDESITYFHQENDEIFECVVLGVRRQKQGGIRYTIAYVGNEDTEVELDEHEMKDILNRRVFMGPE